jgi:DNA-binding CsgD family transcriptional regulator
VRVRVARGDWKLVSRLLAEWADSRERLLIGPTYRRCRALLAAGRGLADEARGWARPALEEAEERGYRWQVLESLRALGVAALVAGEPAEARERLRAVWEHTTREGVDEPGAFPVEPDLVEACIELGNADEARTVAARLRELGDRQEHPWAVTTAGRCEALIGLAAGYDEADVATLARASRDYGERGLHVDAARTLLALGRAQRRARRWGVSRATLESAVDALDAPGWADLARSELSRVGARRRGPVGELSPAEQRVVELAAAGLSNKEIAARLSITVHTVEAHLSHAYAKSASGRARSSPAASPAANDCRFPAFRTRPGGAYARPRAVLPRRALRRTLERLRGRTRAKVGGRRRGAPVPLLDLRPRGRDVPAGGRGRLAGARPRAPPGRRPGPRPRRCRGQRLARR